MKRTTVFIGAAVVVIAGINFGIVSARRATPPPVTAASATDRGGIVAAGPGRVEAVSEEVRVSAQVGGRLQAVLVEENDRVTAGQVLATIDNADYRARVASAEATLRLREAEAVVDNATADVGRRRDLFRDAVISRAELDNAEQAFKVARA